MLDLCFNQCYNYEVKLNKKKYWEEFYMTELKELKGNQLSVTGTLAEKSLELSTDRDGNEIIKGYIRVQVEQNNRVNVVTFNVYNRKFTRSGSENKLFAGFVTVMNQYKSLQDTNGNKDEADRVQIIGDLSYNVYSSDGETVRESNRFRATTCHRVNGQDLEDDTYGSIPAVIESYDEDLDKDGNPTGLWKVKAFTVGYNGRVGRVMDLKIASELASEMQGAFPEGTTGVLYYNILNYVVVKKQNVDNDGGGSFGQIHAVVQSNSYVRQLLIVGGAPLENDELALTEDQIQKAHEELRKQRTEAISRANNKPTAPVKNTQPVRQGGFGSAVKNESNPFANSGAGLEISDDDLPF
ncbi:hypothetical protein [Lactobacillus phage Satyr]|uniref:Uncharacterized protein n=1 Tax=Lactobacillus phage Satyr TaxID=2070201 RepID=A0A2K9V580_9CAUD|nr:hypothetical protein HOS71_gp051 [Lactobacillus phage Satyr]AUV57299.1 hypothetical protein [Lactobacillus phage Satyr]